MGKGGVSASLQSIGASGIIKDQAAQNLDTYQRRVQEHVLQLPSYFSSLPPTRGVPNVLLVIEYKVGGFNATQAAKMLNESMLPLCGQTPAVGCGLSGRQFTVANMQRLENPDTFRRYKRYEAKFATRRSPLGRVFSTVVHPWLQRLAAKNGLSASVNTQYMLHGTDPTACPASTEVACRLPGQVPTALPTDKVSTLQTTVAKQYYGDGELDRTLDVCILICRVVLGDVKVVDESCPQRQGPPRSYTIPSRQLQATRETTSQVLRFHCNSTTSSWCTKTRQSTRSLF